MNRRELEAALARFLGWPDADVVVRHKIGNMWYERTVERAAAADGGKIVLVASASQEKAKGPQS